MARNAARARRRRQDMAGSPRWLGPIFPDPTGVSKPPPAAFRTGAWSHAATKVAQPPSWRSSRRRRIMTAANDHCGRARLAFPGRAAWRLNMSEKIYEISPEWTNRGFINEAKYQEMYKRSIADPNAFWANEAKRIHWYKPPTKIKNTSFDPHDVSIKWFEDGTTNVAYNCLDRHLDKRGDQTAILWEVDDPKDDARISYRQL